MERFGPELGSEGSRGVVWEGDEVVADGSDGEGGGFEDAENVESGWGAGCAVGCEKGPIVLVGILALGYAPDILDRGEVRDNAG